jgi:hypothetical protein
MAARPGRHKVVRDDLAVVVPFKRLAKAKS